MIRIKEIPSEKKYKHDTRESLRGILHEYAERHDAKKLAIKSGIEYPTLMRKLNPNDSQDIHACELVDFIEATKYTWKDDDRRKKEELDPTLLDEIELRLGRVFHLEINPSKYDFSYYGLAKLIKESGEATRSLSESLTDGKVTPQEAENCIKELRDLIHVSMKLIKHLEKIELSGENFILELS